MTTELKGYGAKESSDLLRITQDSIASTEGVSIFARNAFATFLKVNKNKSKISFHASSLGSEARDYMPEYINLLSENTFLEHFGGQPKAELTLLVNHIMRKPGHERNKEFRNTFVKTLADLCARINCALPSGETADMNTLDDGSFYAGLSTISFGSEGYELNLANKVIVMHADGIGTKPNVYVELFNNNLITIEEFLGFVQDGLAMNLNDILVGALSVPEQTYMTNNIIIGRGFEGKEQLIINELQRLSDLTNITMVENNLVYMPDFQGIELDMVLTSVYDEKSIPDMTVSEGDVIIGIASNGVHSNGLSGARRYADKLDEKARLEFYKLLAKPTTIYDNLFRALKGIRINTAVNITGDAFKKILKILPSTLDAYIDNPQTPQELFKEVYANSEFTDESMYDYFNCGTGLMLVVAPSQVSEVLDKISTTNFDAKVIGRLEKGVGQVIIDSAFNDTRVIYK